MMELASSAQVIEVRENALGVCKCCCFYCFFCKVCAATQQISVSHCSLSRTVFLGPTGVGDLLAAGVTVFTEFTLRYLANVPAPPLPIHLQQLQKVKVWDHMGTSQTCFSGGVDAWNAGTEFPRMVSGRTWSSAISEQCRLAFCLGKGFEEFYCATCAMPLVYKLKTLVSGSIISSSRFKKRKVIKKKSNTLSNFRSFLCTSVALSGWSWYW